MSRAAAIVAFLAILPAAVDGQSCMGGASFHEDLLQAGLYESSSASSRSMTSALTLGSAVGPFASVGFGAAHDRNLNDNASMLTAFAGNAFSIPTNPGVELCPFISALLLRGVDLPGDRHLSSQAYGLGASVAIPLGWEEGFQVVPFASAALVLEDATIHTGRFGPTLATNDSYDSYSLGMGLVFRNRFTLRPSTTLTIAPGLKTETYALGIAISFGHVRREAPVVRETESLASVWINPRAKIYYCADSRWFGNTADGEFATEREAVAAGYAPDHGKGCAAKESSRH